MRQPQVGESDFFFMGMQITGEEPDDQPFPRPWMELRKNNYGVDINIESYGCRNTPPWRGGVLHLEVDEDGYVKLYVWGDITQEEPTHVISLERASEEYREEDEDE